MKLIIRTFKPICDSFSVSIGFYLVSKRILAKQYFELSNVKYTCHYISPYLQAWDSDAGLNSQLQYSFVRREGDGADRFLMDPATGQVKDINLAPSFSASYYSQSYSVC